MTNASLEAEVDPVAAPVAAGPRQRLEQLCDAGSFRAIRSTVMSRLASTVAQPGDGVVGGVGRVKGRPVACYAQDGTLLAGALGEAHAETIHRVMEVGERSSMPVVGFVESAGARLQEGNAALGGYGKVFRQNVRLSTRVPQISVITGLSAGGGCYSPALTDFVIMVKSAALFLTGPAIVRQATGEECSVAKLGSPAVHSRNGVSAVTTPDVDSAVKAVRSLLSYLPQRFGERVPLSSVARPEHDEPGACLPAKSSQVYDMRRVIAGVIDGGSFFELNPRWARNVVTGFARLHGRSVGVLANQPRHLGGVLDVDGSQKAAGFVERCNAFGIPLIVLVDTPGFMPGQKQEGAGIIRLGALLVKAFASATVPRVTVVVRKAYGGAYIAMNSKDLGASFVFAWPDAEIGIMSGHAAAEIIHRKELEATSDREMLRELRAADYRRERLSAEFAAAGGFVDEIVAPSETRSRVAWALDVTAARSSDHREWIP